MKRFLIFLILLVVLLGGCEPISIDNTEPGRDIVADVQALVTLDSVITGQDFTVRLSYPDVCGATYKGILVNYDTLNHVFLQPILHYERPSACPQVIDIKTVTATVNFDQSGGYQIVAVGNFGTFYKTIEVANSLTSDTLYSLNFQFENRRGDALYFHQSQFTLISTTPAAQFDIVTDENGKWDTTFAASSSTLLYSIAGFSFTAQRGVIEEGVIIIP
ncbi:MAG: hypothetical protein EPO24_00640 [Bacteroidetes bacterium]|nr:MAG: hypothetical protein EPO24_00640 [Bacteroidota bacterium]